MIIGFIMINLLMYFVGMIYCKFGSLILYIPKSILATTIVVLAVVGAFATSKNLFDVMDRRLLESNCSEFVLLRSETGLVIHMYPPPPGI